MRSDEDLMRLYIDGDQQAFQQLFERYAPILLRLMQRGIFQTQDAQDLVQKTFLQLHRARNDFRLDSALRPWLMTIALNLKREYLRQRKRQGTQEQKLKHQAKVLEGLASSEKQRPDQLERQEQAKQVRAALALLPDAQREVIELHWLEGIPFPEVAVIVGSSLSAVKVRAHRGYKRLKELVKQQQ
jgi:RNA polymerase sigma-70 factor (ECF subfamily)